MVPCVDSQTAHQKKVSVVLIYTSLPSHPQVFPDVPDKQGQDRIHWSGKGVLMGGQWTGTLSFNIRSISRWQ